MSVLSDPNQQNHWEKSKLLRDSETKLTLGLVFRYTPFPTSSDHGQLDDGGPRRLSFHPAEH